MSFIAELKRRNVFRVAAAYFLAGWLILEVGSALADIYGAPGWVLKMLVGILTVGFPVALLFSWAYELTPEGLKRDKDVVRDDSIAPITAKRLDKITIGLIVFAVAFVLLDRLWLRTGDPVAPATVVDEPRASRDTAVPEAAAPDTSIAVLPSPT